QRAERDIVGRHHRAHHADAAQYLRYQELIEIEVAGDPGHLVGTEREDDETARDDVAQVEKLHQPADHRRHEEHGDARDEHGLADHHGAVAAHLGEIARIDIGQSVQTDADAELQHA